MKKLIALSMICLCVSCSDQKKSDDLKLKDYQRMVCNEDDNGWLDWLPHPPIIEEPLDPVQPKDENGDEWA